MPYCPDWQQDCLTANCSFCQQAIEGSGFVFDCDCEINVCCSGCREQSHKCSLCGISQNEHGPVERSALLIAFFVSKHFKANTDLTKVQNENKVLTSDLQEARAEIQDLQARLSSSTQTITELKAQKSNIEQRELSLDTQMQNFLENVDLNLTDYSMLQKDCQRLSLMNKELLSKSSCANLPGYLKYLKKENRECSMQWCALKSQLSVYATYLQLNSQLSTDRVNQFLLSKCLQTIGHSKHPMTQQQLMAQNGLMLQMRQPKQSSPRQPSYQHQRTQQPVLLQQQPLPQTSRSPSAYQTFRSQRSSLQSCSPRLPKIDKFIRPATKNTFRV